MAPMKDIHSQTKDDIVCYCDERTRRIRYSSSLKQRTHCSFRCCWRLSYALIGRAFLIPRQSRQRTLLRGTTVFASRYLSSSKKSLSRSWEYDAVAWKGDAAAIWNGDLESGWYVAFARRYRFRLSMATSCLCNSNCLAFLFTERPVYGAIFRRFGCR